MTPTQIAAVLRLDEQDAVQVIPWGEREPMRPKHPPRKRKRRRDG